VRATDSGRLQPRIQNDVSEILHIGRTLLQPGGSATMDFCGKPMVLSRAAVGHGIALQEPHDFAAGNRTGYFFDTDAANGSTIELDGEDIAYGNPLLRTAYGTVQALLSELKTRRAYF
jgi:hypothetical protein